MLEELIHKDEDEDDSDRGETTEEWFDLWSNAQAELRIAL